MISNRHVRNDWQTFVEWDKKSVRTMCGQKSTPRLSGIPGITIQEAKVNQKPGWCARCIVKTMKVAVQNTSIWMHPDVRHLYQKVLDVCYEQITSPK